MAETILFQVIFFPRFTNHRVSLGTPRDHVWLVTTRHNRIAYFVTITCSRHKHSYCYRCHNFRGFENNDEEKGSDWGLTQSTCVTACTLCIILLNILFAWHAGSECVQIPTARTQKELELHRLACSLLCSNFNWKSIDDYCLSCTPWSS